MICDSIPKYVNVNGLKTTAFPGANIHRIKKYVEENSDVINSHSFLIIHVGTNNVEYSTTSQILLQYADLISTAIDKLQDVKLILSSIIPRPKDFKLSNPKILKVNIELAKMCQTFDIKFVKTYKYFLKRAKPIDYLYTNRDGLHLNRLGTKMIQKFFQCVMLNF